MPRKRIEFYLLTNPTRILADEKNWVKGLECIKWVGRA